MTNQTNIQQQLQEAQGQLRVMNYLVHALANYQNIEVQAIKKRLGSKATDAEITRELLVEMERKAQAIFLENLAKPQKE